MQCFIKPSSLTSAGKQTHLSDRIHDLATKGDLGGVREILEKNPELVSSYDIDGQIPLHFACKFGHFDLVEYLVEQGILYLSMSCFSLMYFLMFSMYLSHTFLIFF